ncbi:MAG: ion transporter [Ekhidna sp.]|nr:ion transporter [Ekhidna sp.]
MKFTKQRVFETLEKGTGDDKLSKRFDVFIMTLIIINVILVILETVEPIYVRFKFWFDLIETISVIIFSIEYLGRVWTCTLMEKHEHPFWGQIKYIFSWVALIDLFAILPFYLPLLFAMDGRFIRILRIFRLVRLFKMGRYSTAFGLIIQVFKKRREELIISLTFLLVMLIFASGLMYYIEHEAQPEAFSSIPETMWWGVATLTTVGYGDVYPVTALGRFLGAIIAILGVGLFALPAGIIASGFESELSKRKKDEE